MQWGDVSSNNLVLARNLVSHEVQLPECDILSHKSMHTLGWTANLVSNEQAHQGLSGDASFVENIETHLELWPKILMFALG